MNLLGCEKTRIGDATTKGCSGGEIRRCSLAESIIEMRQVYLLDKITTGLDSTVTYHIISFLTKYFKVNIMLKVAFKQYYDHSIIATRTRSHRLL